jgi:hypothetical protein
MDQLLNGINVNSPCDVVLLYRSRMVDDPREARPRGSRVAERSWSGWTQRSLRPILVVRALTPAARAVGAAVGCAASVTERSTFLTLSVDQRIEAAVGTGLDRTGLTRVFSGRWREHSRSAALRRYLVTRPYDSSVGRVQTIRIAFRGRAGEVPRAWEFLHLRCESLISALAL